MPPTATACIRARCLQWSQRPLPWAPTHRCPTATLPHPPTPRLQIASLKALGLNIRRAKLTEAGAHRFYVTDSRTSEKVIKSAKLEVIRLTILQNLLQFHPESGEQLAWGTPAARAGEQRAGYAVGGLVWDGAGCSWGGAWHGAPHGCKCLWFIGMKTRGDFGGCISQP